MYSSKVVQSIVFPIVKENIFPCSRRFCRCIEYLNFSKEKDVQYYKNCMINDLKDDHKRHKISVFDSFYNEQLYWKSAKN